MLSRSSTHDGTRIPSLLYYIKSFVLLKATPACTDKLWSSKILWPGLSKSFPFALCISNDDSNFWKMSSFGSKKIVLSKTNNKQSWKSSKVKFWPKPNVQNVAYAKPISLELDATDLL